MASFGMSLSLVMSPARGGVAIEGWLGSNGFSNLIGFGSPTENPPTGVPPSIIVDPIGIFGGQYGAGGPDTQPPPPDSGIGTRGELTEAERREAFQRGLAEQFPDVQQGTTAGRFIQRQFAPAQTAFLGQELLRGVTDPESVGQLGAFERFVGGTPIQDLRGQAGSLFSQLANIGTQRGAARGDIPTLDPAIQAIINPQEEQQGRILQDLAREAFTNRFGGFLGGILSPQRLGTADLLGRFRAQRDTGQFAFTDFLRRRFGLAPGISSGMSKTL